MNNDNIYFPFLLFLIKYAPILQLFAIIDSYIALELFQYFLGYVRAYRVGLIWVYLLVSCASRFRTFLKQFQMSESRLYFSVLIDDVNFVSSLWIICMIDLGYRSKLNIKLYCILWCMCLQTRSPNLTSNSIVFYGACVSRYRSKLNIKLYCILWCMCLQIQVQT